MPDVTLETIANRLEAIDLRLASMQADVLNLNPQKDWRKVAGISEVNGLTRAMDQEIQRGSDEHRAGPNGTRH